MESFSSPFVMASDPYLGEVTWDSLKVIFDFIVVPPQTELPLLPESLPLELENIYEFSLIGIKFSSASTSFACWTERDLNSCLKLTQFIISSSFNLFKSFILNSSSWGVKVILIVEETMISERLARNFVLLSISMSLWPTFRTVS